MTTCLFDLPVTGDGAGRGDYHAHVFRAGVSAADHPRYVPDYDATPEDYIRVLRAHGCAWGTLVQPSFLGVDNSYLLDSLDQYPKDFRGVVVVDSAAPQATVPDAAELHARGVRGVRLNLVGGALPRLEDLPWQAFMRTMADFGWHLEFQANAAQQRDVLGLLPRIPCAVVIDHFGLPTSTDIQSHPLLELAQHDRVWVKASGAYRCAPDAADAMLEALRSRGFERIVPGSDWPHTRYENAAAGAWDYF